MIAETLQDFAIKHSDLLVSKAIKGDEHAFSKLMSLWYKRIFNFCFKYFHDHDLAMEMTQKTFISVHKGISGLKETGRFRPWLYRIALNKCHEEERRVKSKSWFQLFTPGTSSGENHNSNDNKDINPMNHPADEPMFNPGASLEQKELGEVLMECLGALPQEQKVVLIMKEYEGLKFREIAEALQISENTAKSRLYYGLRAMKSIMKERNLYKDTLYYES